MENIATIIIIACAVVLLFVFTFNPIKHIVSSRKSSREQAKTTQSPYNKGYTAFDLDKVGAKQSFIHKLLEDPKYVHITRDEKLYRIREIMHEIMIRYGSSWIAQDMEPHKNSDDEEQFWLGARDAILQHIQKDTISQSVKESTSRIAEARQRAIDQIYQTK